MATRPVFVPNSNPDQPELVHEHEVDFQWVPGSSPGRQRENVAKLHAAVGRRNLAPLLEVSPESNDPLGVLLGVSNLAVEDDRSYLVPLPAAYQGNKVFTGGGPFTDLFTKGEKEISTDERLTVRAIHRYPKLRRGLHRFKGFTDIDCHSGDTSVCHARSCALFVALVEKKLMDEVVGSQDRFIEVLLRDSYYRPKDGNGG